MKDLDPSHPDSGVKPFWCINTPELDELGLTKAEFRIFQHISRRAGPPHWICYAGIKSMARITRTHPDYVRWVIRHLIQRKLVLRVKRPGQSSHLRVADKMAWLAKHGMDADQVSTAYEETAAESAVQELWGRLWKLIPTAPKIRYERRMKENRHLFESVLADVEERVKRGASPRYSADRLGAVKDVVGLFEFTWTKFSEANKK